MFTFLGHPDNVSQIKKGYEEQEEKLKVFYTLIEHVFIYCLDLSSCVIWLRVACIQI